MERRVSGLVAVLAVLVTSVTTAVAMTVTDDESWIGHRDGMMSSQGYGGGDGRDSQSPGWQGLGKMMPGGMLGMMQATWVGNEYAYLAEMVADHEEAVAAAEQLQRSQRSQMRELGETITTSQSAQSTRCSSGSPTGSRTVPGGSTTSR